MKPRSMVFISFMVGCVTGPFQAVAYRGYGVLGPILLCLALAVTVDVVGGCLERMAERRQRDGDDCYPLVHTGQGRPPSNTANVHQ